MQRNVKLVEPSPGNASLELLNHLRQAVRDKQWRQFYIRSTSETAPSIQLTSELLFALSEINKAATRISIVCNNIKYYKELVRSLNSTFPTCMRHFKYYYKLKLGSLMAQIYPVQRINRNPEFTLDALYFVPYVTQTTNIILEKLTAPLIFRNGSLLVLSCAWIPSEKWSGAVSFLKQHNRLIEDKSQRRLWF